ncbi:MAG: hypothetical protein CM15mP109_03390 [Candidatus Dadabacteria bacterium]|nr:MAG: hypothetical protein CM15mP109_03390 [Candidatus Dadabacteria bacterium]
MRTKVHFDNLTPLYPDEALTMEILDADKKIYQTELLIL